MPMSSNGRATAPMMMMMMMNIHRLMSMKYISTIINIGYIRGDTIILNILKNPLKVLTILF